MISAVRGSWDKSELLIPGHKLLLICWYVDGCRTWVFEGSIGICSWLYLLSVLFSSCPTWFGWTSRRYMKWRLFPLGRRIHEMTPFLDRNEVCPPRWDEQARTFDQFPWDSHGLVKKTCYNSTARDIWDLISSWISAQWWIQQSMHVDPGSIFGKDLGGFEEFEFGIATTKTTAWDLHPAGVG